MALTTIFIGLSQSLLASQAVIFVKNLLHFRYKEGNVEKFPYFSFVLLTWDEKTWQYLEGDLTRFLIFFAASHWKASWLPTVTKSWCYDCILIPVRVDRLPPSIQKIFWARLIGGWYWTESREQSSDINKLLKNFSRYSFVLSSYKAMLCLFHPSANQGGPRRSGSW